MIYRVFFAVALSILSCVRWSEAADTYTGNDLYALCAENELTCAFFVFGWQTGYLAGDWERTDMGGREAMNVAPRGTGSPSQALVCFPAETSPRQLRDVIWKHLNARPAQRSQPAWLFIWAAFVKEWPC